MLKLRYILLGGLSIALLGIALGNHLLVGFPSPFALQKGNGPAAALSSPSAQSSSGNTTEQSIPDAVFQRVNPAVVTVYATKEMGSGMILRSEGLVLTNKHIIQNSSNVKVKTASGEIYEGRVIDFDLRYDLALVKLAGQNVNLPAVTLAKSVNLRPGDPVYAIGSPAGNAGTLTVGTFVRTTEHGSLQTSKGLLSPGNSGGPLLNTEAEVIGINKGLLTDNSGLATSVIALKELIRRYDLIHKPESQG